MGFPRLIYGTLGLEGLDRTAAARAVHAAIDHGFSAFDTAPLYGLGAVEENLGHALREQRQSVSLLSKCGIVWDSEHGEVLFENWLEGRRRIFRKNSRPDSVRQEVHRSLSRLGVERIDVMQLHQFDAQVPIEETLGALEVLVGEGKLGAIGVSNFPLAALRASAAHLRPGSGLACVQDEYSALARAAEGASLGWAREHGCPFLAYSPLAQGLLAGRYLGAAALPSDYRKDTARFAPEARRRLARVLEGPGTEIAKAAGMTLGQLSLHWLLSRPGVAAVIVGGRSAAQIAENAGTLQKTASGEALAAFDQALSGAGVVESAGGLRRQLGTKIRDVWAKLRY